MITLYDCARPQPAPGEQHPHLQRWRAGMAQRPAMAL